MKNKLLTLCFTTLCCAQIAFAGHHEEGESTKSNNESVAVGWLKTQASNKADTLAYVKTHLADDGTIYGDRYVGFGFTWNPNQKGKMIVDRIVEGSPASKVLKSGDDFIKWKASK